MGKEKWQLTLILLQVSNGEDDEAIYPDSWHIMLEVSVKSSLIDINNVSCGHLEQAWGTRVVNLNATGNTFPAMEAACSAAWRVSEIHYLIRLHKRESAVLRYFQVPGFVKKKTSAGEETNVKTALQFVQEQESLNLDLSNYKFSSKASKPISCRLTFYRQPHHNFSLPELSEKGDTASF